MAKKRRIRGFIQNNFNLKTWLGYEHIKSGAGIITSAARTAVNTSSSTKQPDEEFNDAIARLNLSDKDLDDRQTGYLKNFYIFFLLGFILALYCLYRFYSGQFLAGIVSFLLTGLAFVFSMFSHFWYFQIKNRKLGCSLKEWFNNKIN